MFSQETITSSRKKNYLPLFIAGGFFAMILAVFLACFAAYWQAGNYGNRMEVQLEEIKSNNTNIYAQGTQKILEIAQVPNMYKDDLKELVIADIQGRYGPDGSKASVQFLKERELKLDTAMYTKIQQVVEGFRNDFQNNQSRAIEVRRSYRTALGSNWDGFWLRQAGYPKIDLKQFDPIITTRTEEVFKKGKEDGPLKLR